MAYSVIHGLLLSTYHLLLSRGVENEIKRALEFLPGRLVHPFTQQFFTIAQATECLWNGHQRCEEHTYLLLVERSFHPGGVSLVTSASYKWLLGANILSHLSRKSIYTKNTNIDMNIFAVVCLACIHVVHARMTREPKGLEFKFTAHSREDLN